MKSLLKRTLSTLVLSGASVYIFLRLNIFTWFVALILIIVLAIFAISEFHQCFKNEIAKHKILTPFSITFAVMLIMWISYSCTVSYLQYFVLPFAYIALFSAFSLTILLLQKTKDTFFEALIAYFPIAFFILPLASMIHIYYMDKVDNTRNLLFLVAVSKLGDIGAYLIGVSTAQMMPGGNHKIFPELSPKKSWEGFFAGLIFSIGTSWLMAKSSLSLPLNKVIQNNWLIMGIILYFGAVLGDLLESAYKRVASIKDSGSVIPGIGGVMDLLDSLVINSLLVYYIILFQK